MIAKFLKNFEEKIIYPFFGLLFDYIVRNRLSPISRNLPLLPLIENKIVLDIGCGTAHLPIKLTKIRNDLFIIGLDISKYLLRIAKRRIKKEGLRVKGPYLICADTHFLPFRDSSVGFIISTGSLHHWNDVSEVLNEIFRVLKTNGQVRIYDQRKPSSWGEIKNAFFVHKFICLGLSAFTDLKIKEYLEKSPFTNYEFIKDGASIEIRLFKN